MQYEITGTVKKTFDMMSFPSGFSKRDLVLTTDDDRFPQDILITFVKEGCAQLDGVNAGERLRIHFRLRGREYKERFYVNLEAFKMERMDVAAGAPPSKDVTLDEPPLDDGPMPF